jgi:hypothetical protein
MASAAAAHYGLAPSTANPPTWFFVEFAVGFFVMGCSGRSHKLGFLLSLQWVFSGFLVGLRWIFVGLRWVWVSGDRRRLADLEVVSRWSHGGYDRPCLADLEVVSRWCSFAVVRGFAISFAVVLGFADLRPSGCRRVLQWVKMWLPVVVLL